MKKLFLFFCLLFQQSWAQVTFTPLIVPTSQTLRGIHFSDSLIGYSCGNGGIVLKTTDGGATWLTQNTNTASDLWDIKVIPGTAGQAAIVVGDNNTILKTTDGGINWLAQSIPFQSGSFVFGVQCLDSLTYFACGGDFGTFSGAVLKTTNGGANWTSTSVNGSIFLDKIFMQNSTKGFAVGTNNSFSNGSIRKTSNGSSWSLAKTSASIITNVWCPSPTVAIATGLNGQIWKSTNDGVNWSNTSSDQSDFYGIQFRDSVYGFVCGGNPTASAVFSSTNAGNNWSANTSYTFSGAFQSICIIQNKIYVAGDLGTIIKAQLSPLASPPPPPPPTTGVEKGTEQELIQIYTDAAYKRIVIKMPQSSFHENLYLEIRDNLGNLVRTATINPDTSELSTDGLTSGVYFYRLSSPTKSIKTGKLVVD